MDYDEKTHEMMDRAKKLAENRLNQAEETRIVDFAESMNKVFDEKEQAIRDRDRTYCENDKLYKDILKFNKLLGNIDLETKGAIEAAQNVGFHSVATTSLYALRNIRKAIDEFDKDRNREKEVYESYLGTGGSDG